MSDQDTTSQIQTEISQLRTRVRLNGDRIAAVRHLVEYYRGMVQRYVARAVAASNVNNPDPQGLQSALENLNTLNAEIDAQGVAEDVIANTDAPDGTTTDPTLDDKGNPIIKPGSTVVPGTVPGSSTDQQGNTTNPGGQVIPPVPPVDVASTPGVSDATKAEMTAGQQAVQGQPTTSTLVQDDPSKVQGGPKTTDQSGTVAQGQDPSIVQGTATPNALDAQGSTVAADPSANTNPSVAPQTTATVNHSNTITTTNGAVFDGTNGNPDQNADYVRGQAAAKDPSIIVSLDDENNAAFMAGHNQASNQ